MRYPLVDGQGNFGSVDGDSAAAMRYTEARMSKIAGLMLDDIDKDTVDFVDNFDGSLQEPNVFRPACLICCLMAPRASPLAWRPTSPPTILIELVNGLVYLLDNYDHLDDVGVDDLMQFVKGPDFPTGAMILGDEGIRSAYATGKGRVVMRAVSHFDEMKGGRYRIVITEIPYQVNKALLMERIANWFTPAALTPFRTCEMSRIAPA